MLSLADYRCPSLAGLAVFSRGFLPCAFAVTGGAGYERSSVLICGFLPYAFAVTGGAGYQCSSVSICGSP